MFGNKSSSFSFGSGANKPTSGGFSFGNNSNNSNANANKPAFSFGNSNTNTNTANKPLFGAQNTNTQTSNSGFGFGSNNNNNGNTASTSFGAANNNNSGNTGFGFGANSNNNNGSNNSGNTGFGFGNNNANKAGFGLGGSTSNNTAAKPAFSFGANTNNTASKPSFGFGNNANASSSKPAFGFGNTATNTAAKPGFSFGNNTASMGSKPGFGFGNNVSTASKPGFSFGNNNNSTSTSTGSTSGGLFGNKPAAGGGLFGNSTNSNTNGGMFASKPSGGLFGSGTNNNSTSLFGNKGPSNGLGNSGGLFGNNNNNGMFGNNNNNNNQQIPQLTSMTKVSDLPDGLKNQLVQLDEYIQTEMSIAEYLKSNEKEHNELIDSIPRDIRYLEKKSSSTGQALSSDLHFIESFKAKTLESFNDWVEKLIKVYLQLTNPMSSNVSNDQTQYSSSSNVVIGINGVRKVDPATDAKNGQINSNGSNSGAQSSSTNQAAPLNVTQIINSYYLTKIDDFKDSISKYEVILKEVEDSINSLDKSLLDGRRGASALNDNYGLEMIVSTLREEFKLYVELANEFAEIHHDVKHIVGGPEAF